jgi:hypothetical protein
MKPAAAKTSWPDRPASAASEGAGPPELDAREKPLGCSPPKGTHGALADRVNAPPISRSGPGRAAGPMRGVDEGCMAEELEAREKLPCAWFEELGAREKPAAARRSAVERGDAADRLLEGTDPTAQELPALENPPGGAIPPIPSDHGPPARLRISLPHVSPQTPQNSVHEPAHRSSSLTPQSSEEFKVSPPELFNGGRRPASGVVFNA